MAHSTRLVPVLALLGLPALAQASVPGGPWVTPTQEVSLQGFAAYAELVKKLTQLERRSGGLMGLEPVATTGRGRTVWLAKIGDPAKTPVMIITQQHGNERHGTEAALELIQKLVAGGGFAETVLDQLYVLVIPRVNPNGAVFTVRGNTDFNAPPPNASGCFDAAGNLDPALLDQGRGVLTTTAGDPDVPPPPSYDINRYHWVDWSQSWQIRCNPARIGSSPHFDLALNPVPEAVGVRRAYDTYRPIWMVDVHNQFDARVADDVDPAVNRPGRMITGSILWPTNEAVHPVALAFSKQLTVVMKRRAQQLGNMEVTNYFFRNAAGVPIKGDGFPGIARNAYGLLGSARLAAGEPGPLGGSVLVEVRGIGLGQKSIGMLKNNAREMREAGLLATADGSVHGLDPAEADALLPPGEETDVFIANPRGEADSEHLH